MLIKQRKVRHSDKFSPRFIKYSNKRRELAIAQYGTAIVLLALAVALTILSYESFVIFQTKIKGMSSLQAYALPLLFLAGGLIALRSSVSTFKRVRREQKEVEEFYRQEAQRENEEGVS